MQATITSSNITYSCSVFPDTVVICAREGTLFSTQLEIPIGVWYFLQEQVPKQEDVPHPVPQEDLEQHSDFDFDDFIGEDGSSESPFTVYDTENITPQRLPLRELNLNDFNRNF